MKVLLDTQVWLWMQAAPGRLAPSARSLIEDVENTLLFSAASSWEIAIKYARGWLPLPERPEAYVPERMRTSGVVGLPIEHAHALRAAGLAPHHRDPFDRMLIAQAQLEGASLATADPAIKRYEVDIVHAG